MGRRRFVEVSLLIALALAACGDEGAASGDGAAVTARELREAIPEHAEHPGPQAKTTYAGRLDGSPALIAIVVNERAAAAYICDGARTSEWFLGTPNGTALQLAGEKGGSLVAELAAGSVAGTLTTAVGAYTFAAPLAVEFESGIYRSVEDVDGQPIVTSWIFFDGEWRGADEDSGKNVVGSVSVSGVSTATGSGTGLAPSSPPETQTFDCGATWCELETSICFISRMLEERRNLKGKKLVQANAMISAAMTKRAGLGDSLSENNCVGTSSCAGSGFDNVSDPPNCSGG